jgi:hypothetical protein
MIKGRRQKSFCTGGETRFGDQLVGETSMVMGVPLNAGWFMDHGKSIYKWMMTGDSPISGNLHISEHSM